MSNEQGKQTQRPLTKAETEQEMLKGWLYDIKAARNRVAGEMAKVAMEAGGIVDLNNNKKFSGVIDNFVDSTVQGAASVENARISISKAIDENKEWFDATKILDIQKRINNDAKTSLMSELSSEQGVKSLIAEYFKQEAFGSLAFFDSNNKILLSKPEDKNPITDFISKGVSIPLPEMLRLAVGDTMLAQRRIKDVIQQRIPEFFGPNNAHKAKSENMRLMTVDTSKLNSNTPKNIQNQKNFAAKVNEDIIAFAQKNLAQKIVHDALTTDETTQKNPTMINQSAQKFATQISLANIPLKILTSP